MQGETLLRSQKHQNQGKMPDTAKSTIAELDLKPECLPRSFSYHEAGIFSNGWLGVYVDDGRYLRKEAGLSRFLVVHAFIETRLMLVGD